jgi:putative endonuclease
MGFHVCILASQRNGKLYTGHTDDLSRRIWEHKTQAIPGFTAQFGVTRLVWYEQFEMRETAFARERAIKKWRRAWKIEMIERFNPGWRDLYDELEPE